MAEPGKFIPNGLLAATLEVSSDQEVIATLKSLCLSNLAENNEAVTGTLYLLSAQANFVMTALHTDPENSARLAKGGDIYTTQMAIHTMSFAALNNQEPDQLDEQTQKALSTAVDQMINEEVEHIRSTYKGIDTSSLGALPKVFTPASKKDYCAGLPGKSI